MKLKHARSDAIILKRYKRFLADIQFQSGEITTVHTANTGSMRSCWEKGWKVCVSDSKNINRKYPLSLEMIHNGKTWIGVNTIIANHIVEEHIRNGFLTEFTGFKSLRREVKYGKSSRIDLLLEFNNDANCYIEVKNVTLREENTTIAYFPDAISKRGLKHIHELIEMKRKGFRAVLFFLIQREDVTKFCPAYHIHPEYAEALKVAFEKEVEILPYQCSLCPSEIFLNKKLPFCLDVF